MAEHWIPCSKALELAGEASGLFSKLQAGSVIAKAKVLWIDGERRENSVIPVELWAEGLEAIVQDWHAGDFSTPTDQNKRIHALGVSFALSGILKTLEVEQRAAVARSLSVSSDPDWLPAPEIKQMGYGKAALGSFDAGTAILEQARLGFITARAVLAQARVFANAPWLWQEREWDIPNWFWTDFKVTQADMSFATNNLSVQGTGPNGERHIVLSGVHFFKESLGAVAQLRPAQDIGRKSAKGRPPMYDWEAARVSIWGQIYRGDLKPTSLVTLEKAFESYFVDRKQEPSEAMLRVHASRIWKEIIQD